MATISINNLAHAIYDSSKDKSGKELERVMQNTVQFLADKHMLGKAPQIIDKVEEITDEHAGIVRAKVGTTSRLHQRTIGEIESIVKKKYKAKDVILTLEEDEKLLGGVKIQVRDEVIDMTLSNKLDKLHNYLIQN